MNTLSQFMYNTLVIRHMAYLLYNDTQTVFCLHPHPWLYPPRSYSLLSSSLYHHLSYSFTAPFHFPPSPSSVSALSPSPPPPLPPPGIIYQHKCWLSSCWCYRVGGFFVCFFITLTRGTDTIDSPTGPRRSYVAFERIGKQMDFRGSILAAARSLNSNS